MTSHASGRWPPTSLYKDPVGLYDHSGPPGQARGLVHLKSLNYSFSAKSPLVIGHKFTGSSSQENGILGPRSAYHRRYRSFSDSAPALLWGTRIDRWAERGPASAASCHHASSQPLSPLLQPAGLRPNSWPHSDPGLHARQMGPRTASQPRTA